MELILSLLIYAAISSTASSAAIAADCAQFGVITEQETQYAASTCFVRRNGKWIPADKATYP